MQAALASAALSNQGIMPAPRIAWLSTRLRRAGGASRVGNASRGDPASDASDTALFFIQRPKLLVTYRSRVGDESEVTWSRWDTAKLAGDPAGLVVAIEENNTASQSGST